jgi:hypothetical protein
MKAEELIWAEGGLERIHGPSADVARSLRELFDLIQEATPEHQVAILGTGHPERLLDGLIKLIELVEEGRLQEAQASLSSLLEREYELMDPSYVHTELCAFAMRLCAMQGNLRTYRMSGPDEV